MVAFASVYVAISIGLGLAWIATEFKLQPRRGLVVEFLLTSLIWPFLFVFVVALLLGTKSKKHDP